MAFSGRPEELGKSFGQDPKALMRWAGPNDFVCLRLDLKTCVASGRT